VTLEGCPPNELGVKVKNVDSAQQLPAVRSASSMLKDTPVTCCAPALDTIAIITIKHTILLWLIVAHISFVCSEVSSTTRFRKKFDEMLKALQFSKISTKLDQISDQMQCTFNEPIH
jgi:hypothetical protein